VDPPTIAGAILYGLPSFELYEDSMAVDEGERSMVPRAISEKWQIGIAATGQCDFTSNTGRTSPIFVIEDLNEQIMS
jgi:hypothetical protein